MTALTLTFDDMRLRAIDSADLLRGAVVAGCALALILAGSPLPLL